MQNEHAAHVVENRGQNFLMRLGRQRGDERMCPQRIGGDQGCAKPSCTAFPL